VRPNDVVRELEAVGALPAIPHDYEGPVFREPWEAQAFAMTVALHEAKLFTWPEWAAALGREIATAPTEENGASYYLHWLAALEKLTVAKGVASAERLAARKAEWDRAAHATPHGQPILLANDPEKSRGRP
jgi:nitrile hydratase accessory protein